MPLTPFTYKIGLDTKTGELVSVEKAREGNSELYVIEHMPKPGYGTAND